MLIINTSKTQEIILIKHTGCGMLTFGNDDALSIVSKNLGSDALAEVKTVFGGEFLPFPDLEDAVREDVEFLKASKAVPDAIRISGWVYEVESGKVRSVV